MISAQVQRAPSRFRPQALAAPVAGPSAGWGPFRYCLSLILGHDAFCLILARDCFVA
jgi:hypothetical protein